MGPILSGRQTVYVAVDSLGVISEFLPADEAEEDHLSMLRLCSASFGRALIVDPQAHK